MALAKLNFDELNDKIEGAVEQEIKLIEELRVAVRSPRNGAGPAL